MIWRGVGKGRKTNFREMYQQGLRKSMLSMSKEQEKLTLIAEGGKKRSTSELAEED